MCGIISIFHNNQVMVEKKVEDLLFNMLWVDSIRGNHSTGIIFETDDGPEWYKKAIPGWDFIQQDYVNAVINKLNRSRYFIGHNRAATRGEVKTSNAHPFEFGDIIGVHNGTLSNHYNLSPQGANHSVDSQHLYHAISVDGFEDVAPRIQGSFNLLWHDKSDNTIHLCKNDSRPYCFAKIKDKEYLIGASEKAMLKWLINRHKLEIEFCWTPVDNTEYVWDVEEDMVNVAYTVEHEKYVPPPVVHRPPAHTTNNQPNNGMGNTNVSTIELLEFFVDTLLPNQHLTNGSRTYTCHGETIEGDSVTMFAVPEGDVEIDTWYTGRGAFINTNHSSSNYWKIFNESVKPHPLECPDESLMVCVNCGVDHLESQGVFVENAPVCLDCCQQLSVQPHQVDEDEGWKLTSQLMH